MAVQKSVTNDILKNATELFLTKGFKSVTMDDLANEMGISKKTIYTHYKTKTDLISASCEFFFQIINTGINEIRARELNPIDELFLINDFIVQLLKDDSSSPEFQLQKYYPKIHSKLSEWKFDAIYNCSIKSVERGKKIGIYRKEIDLEVTSRFYFFSISELKNQALFPRDKFNSYELIKTYLDYHIRAIATTKGVKYLENFYKKQNI